MSGGATRLRQGFRLRRAYGGQDGGQVVRFRSLSARRASAYVRVGSFAFVRMRSLTSAFVRIRSHTIFLFMCETQSGQTRQFLPGGGELRRAPECVTANSPEYATLEGLIHRDSPQYVTKIKYLRMGNVSEGGGLANARFPSPIEVASGPKMRHDCVTKITT